jgi:hypothetical protein
MNRPGVVVQGQQARETFVYSGDSETIMMMIIIIMAIDVRKRDIHS